MQALGKEIESNDDSGDLQMSSLNLVARSENEQLLLGQLMRVFRLGGNVITEVDPDEDATKFGF